MLAKMKHPNIVKYADCFMDANYLIIIMEYCNAGDLAGLIKRQAGQLMPEAHVMFLFVQVCLGGARIMTQPCHLFEDFLVLGLAGHIIAC